MVSAENSVEVAAEKDAELLVVDVRLGRAAMNPFVTVPIGSWEEFLAAVAARETDGSIGVSPRICS